MKKFISFLTALCFSVIFLSVNFPASENMAAFAEEENNWRTLYSEILENAMNSDSYSKSMSMFDLFDVNGDSIPELFISDGTSHLNYGNIYTFKDNDAVKLDVTVSDYGTWLASENILICSHSVSDSYYSDTVYMFENGEINTFYFETNVGFGKDMEYYKINNQEVTEEEYNSKLKSFADGGLESIGRNYKLTKENISLILTFGDIPVDFSNITYKWHMKPSVQADDIIVYSLDEVGYDHSIYNDLAYIQQNGKWGIIDYSGNFLADCTSEYYLVTAPYLGTLGTNSTAFASGNGSFTETYAGGMGLEKTFSYYSEEDNAVFCETDLSHSNCERLNSTDRQYRPVRIAEFEPAKYPNYTLKQDTISSGWGIARGNNLITDCVYDAIAVSVVQSSEDYNRIHKQTFEWSEISALKKGGKWCYVDSNGKILTDFDYVGCSAIPPAQTGEEFMSSEEQYPYLPTEGCIAVKTDDGSGFIDIMGNEIIPAGTFEETRPLHNNLAWVKDKETGLWGVIEICENIIDPDVQAHLDWLEKNENVFGNEDFTLYLKDLMNQDTNTTVYKSLKIITDIDTLNNIDNEKLSVKICLSNLISSREFSEAMHNAGVESVCKIEEKILQFVEKRINEGKSIKDILDVSDAYSKAAESLKSEFDFLMKIKNSASDTAEYIAKREKFISGVFGSCGKEFIPVVAEIAGIAIEEQLENQEIEQDFYDFCMFSAYYKGSTEYMKNAMEILRKSALEKLYEMDYHDPQTLDPAITTDMNVLRYRLVLDEFLECCSNLESADFDAYEYYSQLKKENKNKYSKKYTEAIVKKLVVLSITAFAPEVALVIAIYEASVAVFSIGTDIWELVSDIDERTLERDKALNMFVMADVIDNAMLNSYGFSETLKNNKDRESLTAFEYGMSFYKTIHSLAVNYSMRYFSMLSAKKAGFSMDLIAAEIIRLNRINCHEKMLFVQVLTENFVIETIKCPVNITVLNGTEIAAKIENDKLVMTDNTCNIEIISEDENKSAAKVIIYPADYKLKITGYGTGTMSISKITVSNGELSDSYIAEDIPVEEGYSYSETKENDVTKIGIDYDNDEIYDEYIDLQTDSEEYKIGDVNGDGRTDASDASEVLRIYAAYSTKGASDFTEEQFRAADVNGDGRTDASDASSILQIYAAYSTAKTA